jgi:AcrR family transcriptional regulator
MKQSTPKSEATRARILVSALRVFRERGFHEATMREIAAAAEVAVGAAYYYFDSKDALVMAFYEESQAQMEPALEVILAKSRTLEQRLKGLISHKFEHFSPNRTLMSALSAHIDPNHPLSPFSARTASIRDADIAFFQRAVTDSGVRLPASIQPYLPRLLWLYQMGLMLFWVYDNSPQQARTHQLFDKTLHMLLFALKIASVPLLRPLYRPAGELLKIVYGESAQ